MHANTFRRAHLAGGASARAAGVLGAGDPERRLNATSALLILLAVAGVVVTFLFGMWMIGFAHPTV